MRKGQVQGLPLVASLGQAQGLPLQSLTEWVGSVALDPAQDRLPEEGLGVARECNFQWGNTKRWG